MHHDTYLIIGGGMTAAAAVEGIREADPNGSIGLIGAEPHSPYDRPPLSKGLWKGKPLESIWRKAEGHGVTLHLGRTGPALDPPNKRSATTRGRSTPTISCSWPQAACPAASPSAATESSTSAPWTTTSDCGR